MQSDLIAANAQRRSDVMRIKYYLLSIALSIVAFLPLPGAAQNGAVEVGSGVPFRSAPSGEWLTWGGDPQRTGWNRGEAILNRETVGSLKLIWSVQLPTAPQPIALVTLTSPIVVAGVPTAGGAKDMLYTVGIDDTAYGIDTGSGKIVWQSRFNNTGTPLRKPTVNCSNTEQATPVADKTRGVLFLTTSDGLLRGLDLSNGSERMPATEMVAPFSRNWSLNLVSDVVYTIAGRGCGGSKSQPIEPGTVAAMDLSDLAHPKLSRFYTGKGRAAGPWDPAGPVLGPQGLYVITADGPNDPGSGVYGNAVLAVRPNGWGLADSFFPSNWKYLNARTWWSATKNHDKLIS